MVRQNTEGCKKICKAFLVQRLAERDEIWHNEGRDVNPWPWAWPWDSLGVVLELLAFALALALNALP